MKPEEIEEEITLCRTPTSMHTLSFFPECVYSLTLEEFARIMLFSAEKDTVWGAKLENGKVVLYAYVILKAEDKKNGRLRVWNIVTELYYCEVKGLTNYIVYDPERGEAVKLVNRNGSCQSSDNPDATCIPITAFSARIGTRLGSTEKHVLAKIQEDMEKNSGRGKE